MPKRVTTFQKEWMDPDPNPDWVLWVPPGRLDTEASCTYCKKEFSVSTMGRQALISHAKGDKHQRNEPQRSADQLSLKCFGTTSKEQSQPIVVDIENEELEPTVSGSTNIIVSFTSDGASVMLGCKSSVAQRLKIDHGLVNLIENHCIVHREALALKDMLSVS
uniref:BED-type domain-containing protein n=1 Tax=Romanomermis culicivorax TaxID=13658 RepID=A0A915KY19_ROMCU